MKKHIFLAALLTIAIWTPMQAIAASQSDINKLTTYAVILGRAVACGVDIAPEMKRVGAWIDRTFKPGTSEHRIYLRIFIKGVKHHAQLQSSGNSPDSCAEVRSTYRKMPWP